MRRSSVSQVAVIIMSAMLGVTNASAQTMASAFTYQGNLDAEGLPFDGTVDLEFRLFTLSSGGVQVGQTMISTAVPVVGGAFAVSVDFGTAVFTGQDRFIEIGVRNPAGSTDPFVSLSPRQRITPAPYALVAQSLVAGNNFAIGTGTTPHTPLTFASTTGPKISLWGNATAQFGMGVQNSLYQLYTDSANSDFVFGHGSSTNFTERMRIEGTGNVGIGTNAPVAKLDVAGTGRFTGFQLTGNGAAAGRVLTSNAQGQASWIAPSAQPWIFSGANISYSAGNVGIGTSSPTAPLSFPSSIGAKISLFGDATSRYGLGIAANQQQYFTDNAVSDHVFGYFSGSSFTERARITGAGRGLFASEVVITDGGVRKGGTAVSTSDLGLYSLASGSWLRLVSNNAPIRFFTNGVQGAAFTPANNSAVMSIGTEGNVGIGTDSPQAKLDVAGRARVDILEIDAGADVAERFDIAPAATSRMKPVAGMVVSISTKKAGSLIVSEHEYDRRVAGIISGAGGVNPGLVLGQPGTLASGEHAVACAGRVWCWVDAEFGAVQPGDLLTTSPVAGHAMKVSDASRAPGATVGKAMTALPSGRGLVLVLVSLQ